MRKVSDCHNLFSLRIEAYFARSKKLLVIGLGLLSLLVMYGNDHTFVYAQNIGTNTSNIGTQSTDQTATYRVTFTSTWSQATHPHPNGATSFPPTPHLSGLIGGSHNENVTFWQNGATASLGIKNMAEQGLKTDLQNEVNQAISAGTANTVISGGSIPLSPDSVSISSVVMTKEYPLVTLTSMIAPSPDWFVGVSGLSLLDDQNNWLPEKVVVLYPYDAGTDSGTDYLALDNATTPPAPITRLQDVAPFSNQPIGTFTFTRTDQEPFVPIANYRTDFQADTPAPNWAYLWNATGPIGTATHYSALTEEGGFYSNGTSLHLDATGGQPGPGVNQFFDETTDRYVIAAYTVPESQAYALTQSFLETNDTDCGPDNVVRVHVYVNDTLKKTVSMPTGIRGTFDVELGQLSAGDQIFVAVGPEEENWCDRFEWDFTIATAGQPPTYTPVTTYRTDFQAATPASNWAYLWNATGPIGTATHYSALTEEGGFYSNGSSLHLDASGGQPGPGVNQFFDETTDRYVIAAYTVPEPQAYALTQSFLETNDTDCGPDNVVRVHVYVNDTLKKTVSMPTGIRGTFDVELGQLTAGDQIFVAVGPEEENWCDRFEWDFTIARAGEPPTFTPLATYRTDFQADTPAPNWAYLWNATGPIGTATHYSALTEEGGFYSNGSSLHLDASGGQPGPGVNQFFDETTDRYVIAAYTVPEPQAYALTQGFLETNDTDCGPDNVVRVRVYVNDTLKKTVSIPTGIRGTFDVELGQLSAGDQIFVAVGPEEENWCDRFEWNFSLGATL